MNYVYARCCVKTELFVKYVCWKCLLARSFKRSKTFLSLMRNRKPFKRFQLSEFSEAPSTIAEGHLAVSNAVSVALFNTSNTLSRTKDQSCESIKAVLRYKCCLIMICFCFFFTSRYALLLYKSFSWFLEPCDAFFYSWYQERVLLHYRIWSTL